MLNSMMLFTFSVLDRKYLWANLVQNIKFVCLRWKLAPRLIGIYWNWWWCSKFLFLTRNILFFSLSFLSQTFTIHWTAVEGRGSLFNSSLPLPPTSQLDISWAVTVESDKCKLLNHKATCPSWAIWPKRSILSL